MENKKEFNNLTENGPSSTQIHEEPIFLDRREGKRGIPYIEITFDAYINKDVRDNSNESTTWYKKLGIDRSDASKIRRGLMIPSHDLRLKISKYFKIDSTFIWRREDMDEIRKLLLKQRGRLKNDN